MEAKENNGWIKIESEKDLPKESGAYWITVYSELSNAPFWYNVIEKTFNFRGHIFKFNEVSHYQPIIKPLNPIY